MNGLEQELFETRIAALATALEYPPTPDIAGSVMKRLRPVEPPRHVSRRLAWSLAIVLVLCTSLMLIPPARAAILEFIQIGVVRIFGSPSTPPAPLEETPVTAVPLTATPGPTLPPLIPILEDLAGELTLGEAQQRVDYPILLPSYPSDLGEPDRVFVQDADGDMAILVWLDPQEHDRIRMSLHFLPAGSWAIDKIEPAMIRETRVDGTRAIWAVGPYPLRLRTSEIQFRRLIDGHVLIWEKGRITYRLETDLSLEEAIQIAESLEPIP
jgi:hypothetical protein